MRVRQPCPGAEPGPLACPVTIEDVKAPGSAYVGQHVSFGNVLVTAVGATGFFVQDVPGVDGGPDYSGLFIYQPGSGVNVGDRITVTDGVASNYFGEIQMTTPLLGARWRYRSHLFWQPGACARSTS